VSVEYRHMTFCPSQMEKGLHNFAKKNIYPQIVNSNFELVGHAEDAWLGKSVQGPSVENNTIDVTGSLMHDITVCKTLRDNSTQRCRQYKL